MKQLWFILVGSCLVGFVLAGGCGWSGYRVATDILHNKLNQEQLAFPLFRWCFNGLPFVDQLESLLNNKTYLVLLQNNMELRPSGGFLGSYAAITLQPTGMADLRIQDIYVPDGQLVGHVDPPLPIQQAFGQGWWKLRDANWDPDFKVAAEQTAWFFEQGGEKVDGLIAINLSLANSLIGVLGELKLLDFPDTVTAGNFYQLAQQYAEHQAFPGSTQKKDFLTAVGTALFDKVTLASPRQQSQIAQLIVSQLKTKQILLWFTDSQLQETASIRHWSGELGNPSGNYLYIVESNLGANKANCCIEREVAQTISGNENVVSITWKNTSQYSNPVKPYFWGGDYKNFVRIMLPKSAQVSTVTVGDQVFKPGKLVWQFGLQEAVYETTQHTELLSVGFWAVTPANTSQTAKVEYQVPSSDRLTVRRQPGVDQFSYQLIKDGTILTDTLLTRDEEFALH